MYATAYTSEFRSLEGVCWTVEIDLPDYQGEPIEIGFDADNPVTIEWQETKVTDALQPSTCTLKVINESDRQMVRLMTDRMALCRIMCNGKPYWTGLLDDAVYEEPYSYLDSYVTELTFSDFGILNRINYRPSGVVSLLDIIGECLSAACIDGMYLTQTISLKLTPSTPVGLGEIYVNSSRFEGMTMRETLEGIMQALGMRIIQLGGMILVYDIDRLVDDCLADDNFIQPVFWKGIDARLKGSDTYGTIEIDFDRKSEPVVADGSMDPDKSGWGTFERFYALHFETESIYTSKGFYVGMDRYYSDMQLPTLLHSAAKYFVTRPVMTDSHEAGIAYRVCCYDSAQDAMRNLLSTSTEFYHHRMTALFTVESRPLPIVSRKSDYQIRINLGLLFTIKYNPFEEASEQGVEVRELWERWQESFQRIYVPVKLELVDDSDNVVAHYRNAKPGGHLNGYLIPLGIDKGEWMTGEAQWSEMLLAYYNDDLETNPLDGWTSNRTAIEQDRTQVPDIVKKRADGEYVPLPDMAGRLRLTVANGISADEQSDHGFQSFYPKIQWQLYRDPMMTVVSVGVVDDEVDKDDIVEKDVFNILDDNYRESAIIGTEEKGVSPASLGILFNNAGNAFTQFTKHNTSQSLIKHRLNTLIDQLGTTRPVLSGTARLVMGFSLLSDASTAGLFLPVAKYQNLIEDSEEIVMVKVHNSIDRYSFAWGSPVCACEEEGYRHSWSDPVCARLPDRYSFAWSEPVCRRQHLEIELEWGSF